MENLLESNERTLDIFESVCSGLSGCLTLVHADIRQMIEHRDQLAQQLAELETNDGPHRNEYAETDLNYNGEDNKSNRNGATKLEQQNELEVESSNNNKKFLQGVADPHHLARLKLIDKQLADSFSQALSMCDQQKSSLFAKKSQNNQSSQRPSIFQVLLGKGSQKDKSDKRREARDAKSHGELQQPNSEQQIRSDTRAVIDDINKQTRLAMQYSKQLEAHLFKVEDLRAKYEMHLKMGLVVKNVSRAYLGTHPYSSSSLATSQHHMINSQNSLGRARGRQHHSSTLMVNDHSSLGTRSSLSSLNLSTWPWVKCQESVPPLPPASPHQIQPGGYSDAGGSVYSGDHEARLGGGNGLLHKSASHSSLKRSSKNYYKSSVGQSQHQLSSGTKTTIKEFIENIERIEAEFESYMGSFLLNIEDIQGFARVCQGDVFEINIRYGDSQKFKTKISVLKDNRQKCEHKQSVFKARIADVIAIKAYECKGLGKKVLLGHKLCETRDLFTARSQLMTISLNQTGSIKLNLVITWNPLHLTPKGLDISHVSLPPTPVSSSTLSSLSSARSSMNGVSAVATDNNTTLINIQANNSGGRRIKPELTASPQTSPVDLCCECAGSPEARFQENASSRLSSPRTPQNRQHPKLYHEADTIYSYHIPEPDYLITGDPKY